MAMQEDNQASAEAIHRLRTICMTLPEATERLSHGTPSFYVQGKRCFAMFVDDHHGDSNVGAWCAALPGVQQSLIEEAPEWFFKPPYVGHRGWIGIRLDRNLSWEELEEYVIDAFIAVAPPKLSARIERTQL